MGVFTLTLDLRFHIPRYNNR